jgi:hypothetical protein
MHYIQYSTPSKNAVTIHDWSFNDAGQVTIDGAVLDPQFMRSAQVRLACRSAAEAAQVTEAIDMMDMK